MVAKKPNKDMLTAAEIKEIKKHLLELKEDATKRLQNTKQMDMPEVEGLNFPAMPITPLSKLKPPCVKLIKGFMVLANIAASRLAKNA